MKDDHFQFLSSLIRQRSGLVLNEDKAYLLESRLIPLARKSGYDNLEHMVDVMRLKKDETLMQDVTEAMTTNESFFFRDMYPFDLFRDKVLPLLLKNREGRKSFRIWCSAASSGQEPYSLAIILREQSGRLAGWKPEIIGSDISREMLDKAKAGQYSQFEVQRGLPIQLLLKYFEKQENQWRIKDHVREMVEYMELNLLNSLKSVGACDVVFCRNVLLYFDQETKTRVLEAISELMPEDGVLFLGGAETTLGITDRFKPVPGSRGVYCLASSSWEFD